MIKKLTNTLYHPIIYFFLVPFISILPGSIVASQYKQINSISFIALYIYIVINQLIENILRRIPTNNFQLSKNLLISLEIINGLFILLIGVRYSWMSAAILLHYTIIIQAQFLFTYYDLENTAAFIASFLKVVLLNGIAFYIHTNFFHFRFLPYYFGLFFPYFIYEFTRFEEKTDHKKLLLFIILSYLSAFYLLWEANRLMNILLFLALPFVMIFKSEFKRKYIATFLLSFSFIYIVLLGFIFIR